MVYPVSAQASPHALVEWDTDQAALVLQDSIKCDSHGRIKGHRWYPAKTADWVVLTSRHFRTHLRMKQKHGFCLRVSKEVEQVYDLYKVTVYSALP